MDLFDGWVGNDWEWKDYAWEVQEGEIVSILVDRDKGTLWFKIEDELFPIAYSDPQLTLDPLYFAAQMRGV